MKIKIIGLAILLAAVGGLAAAHGCEMSFSLVGPSGAATRILPGRSVDLIQGQQYVLRVEFTEDHKNCLLEPGDTLFEVNGREWKPGDQSSPLPLGAQVSWQSQGRTNIAEISFKAQEKGTVALAVIRDCAKGGYDESLVFKVK